MDTIPQTATAMQSVLTTDAEQLGRTVGCVQRAGKLSGSGLTQTLVFGYMENPQATLEDLCQTAAVLGVAITPQGLDQRFTPAAAELLKQVLSRAVTKVIASESAAIPVLRRFQGVYLRDSSFVSLPVELAEAYPGFGGSGGKTASIKLQVRYNWSTGQVEGPVVQAGRVHDQHTPFKDSDLPRGALSLSDLGYFNLRALGQADEHGVYYLRRLKCGTQVFSGDGEPLDVIRWLNGQGSTSLDLKVRVGQHEPLQCRLIAVRPPQEVVEQRRRQLREYARKKQVVLTAERLAWADWTLVITNVPVERLSVPEALVLLRVRWQVELVFKLWKSHARIDQWRSHKPAHILCELFAKLIGVTILHWILLTGPGHQLNLSRFKAARFIQKHIPALAIVLAQTQELIQVLMRLQRGLLVTCRMNKRHKQPGTYQLVLDMP